MKRNLRVMDSDIHVFEPISLWAEYLEPRFRDRAPKAGGRGPVVWEVEGKAIPAFLDQPERQRAWRVRWEKWADRDHFQQQEKLSTETKRKVLWDNCARLYGID